MASTLVTPEECTAVAMESIPVLVRFVRAQMRKHGSRTLSVPQFRALGYLYDFPGASLTAVAEHLGVTPPTASVIADRLVRDGILSRAADPVERRRITLTLTPVGETLILEARGAARGQFAKIISHLSPEQVNTISEGISLLSTAISNHGVAKG